MSQEDNRSKESSWKQLEALLGTKLPSLSSIEKLLNGQDASWVGDYVQQMLEKTIPKTGLLRSAKLSYEVFETHNYVIIKMKMPDPLNPLVKVRADQVIIESSYKDKKHEIPLPCWVTPRLSRSTHKDGILQIKLRKRKFNKTYGTIPIRYL